MSDTEQTELFPDRPAEANLSGGGGYFSGRDLGDLSYASRDTYGLTRDGTLYRHSYLYSAEFPVSKKRGNTWESEYGRIELRARTWAYTDRLPEDYAAMVSGSAHRAGALFNSAKEVPEYDGYLDGFNCTTASSAWEHEPVANPAGQAQVGKVDWNLEIYDEDGNLSGIAQGVSRPWRVAAEQEPGREAVSVAPHKWRLSFNEARNSYQVAPEGRSRSRQRYQPGGAGHEKTVYLNGYEIGSIDDEGRTWLRDEYQDGLTYRGQHSREGIVEKSLEATWQSLRDDGVVYMTGETQTGIYLSTSRARPDGYEPVDSDQVAPRQPVIPGREPETRYVLSAAGEADAVDIETRRDERVIRMLGYSRPVYSHAVTRRWRV